MIAYQEIAAEPAAADRGCNGGGAGSGVTVVPGGSGRQVLARLLPTVPAVVISTDTGRLGRELDGLVGAVRDPG